MKLAWILALAGVSVSHARQPGKGTARELAVYVTSDPRVPAKILLLGEGLASHLFQGVGIHLRWLHPSPASRVRLEPAIRLEYRFDCKDCGNETLGAARPYDEGSAVVVFYDRLRWAEPYPVLASRLLGYVLVHEITHNLQGIARHSRSGIMKAVWTESDYDKMSSKSLSFEPPDVSLLREGFDRKSCASGKSPAGSNCAALLKIRGLLPELVEQPDTRTLPVALDGIHGDVQ